MQATGERIHASTAGAVTARYESVGSGRTKEPDCDPLVPVTGKTEGGPAIGLYVARRVAEAEYARHLL